MLQQILAVFFVLLLLLGALWLLRSRGMGSGNISGFNLISDAFGRKMPDRRLRLLERLTLTPQHVLHLVLVEDRVVLFATSPSGCHAVEQTGVSQQVAPARDGAAC